MPQDQNLLSQLEIKKEINDPAKPSLVFLHDSLGCIKLWRDFPDDLAKAADANVIIYDRQGYGKSCAFSTAKRQQNYMEKEADILIDLLDAWQLEQVILFGHSDGASIALIAAGKYPHRIAGVVSEAGHIFVEDITLSGIREAVKAYETTSLQEKLKKYHGDKTEAVFQAWTETWLNPSFKDWTIVRFLNDIICPVFLIQGEADEYGSLAQVAGVEERVKGQFEKLILPKIKHTPHKEVPEVIVKESADFIKRMIT